MAGGVAPAGGEGRLRGMVLAQLKAGQIQRTWNCVDFAKTRAQRAA